VNQVISDDLETLPGRSYQKHCPIFSGITSLALISPEVVFLLLGRNQPAVSWSFEQLRADTPADPSRCVVVPISDLIAEVTEHDMRGIMLVDRGVLDQRFHITTPIAQHPLMSMRCVHQNRHEDSPERRSDGASQKHS
jgi:hypothetical protein